jgi:murein L,D-transpeptidase YcbB/YkuD
MHEAHQTAATTRSRQATLARPLIAPVLALTALAALAAAVLVGAPLAAGASRLLPPKPNLAVAGGGQGEDDGSEQGDGEGDGGDGGGSVSRSSRTLSPASSTAPAAWVAGIQSKLKRLGHYSGPVNGVYGPATTAAVKRFQKRNGLVDDGKWGKATQAALTLTKGTR